MCSGVTSSSLPLCRSMAASLMGSTLFFKSSGPVPFLPCHRPTRGIWLCLNQRAEQCNLQGQGPILRPGSSLVSIQTLSPAGASAVLCKIALSHRDPLAGEGFPSVGSAEACRQKEAPKNTPLPPGPHFVCSQGDRQNALHPFQPSCTPS